MSATAAASRALLRRQPLRLQLRQQTRRTYADSTAEKAKEGANKATSKASEGLSKVTSSAGPALSKAASGVGNALSKVGGRTGRLISFFSSMIPPTVYYSKVGFELSKIIFHSQKMALQISNPSALFSSTTNAVRGASQMSPETFIQRVRNFDRATAAQAGILIAEVLGFFSVGEIVGRMKIVGYRGEVHHEH